MAAPLPEPEQRALAEDDRFRDEFKKYKRKVPIPDYSDVIDFEYASNYRNIESCDLHVPDISPVLGLKPISEWKAYSLKDFPGFLFIVDPFEEGYQRYWVKRCLQDYPSRRNKTNLNITNQDLSSSDIVWSDIGKQILQNDDTLIRLRWVTMGYHYDWNTKEYYADRRTPMPSDLRALATYIAQAVGCSTYSPEATVVNYYHLDSSLGGHTDHSEFDHEAPLISISFGQKAVFLLGGTTKATVPVAMYLSSGDICVMMGPSRLAYHAVPRVLASSSSDFYLCMKKAGTEKYTSNIKQQEFSEKSTNCEEKSDNSKQNIPIDSQENIEDFDEISDKNICKINENIKRTVLNLNWQPFEQYLIQSRINLNIRQVLKPGQTFSESSNCVNPESDSNITSSAESISGSASQAESCVVST